MVQYQPPTARWQNCSGMLPLDAQVCDRTAGPREAEEEEFPGWAGRDLKSLSLSLCLQENGGFIHFQRLTTSS